MKNNNDIKTRFYREVLKINTEEKQLFLESGFTEDDWNFYSNYPRLFALYDTFNDFTLSDLQRWHKKYNCNSDIFSNIVKALHSRICFKKYKLDLPNTYSNLEKYDFVYFMDNIENFYLIEKIPKYPFGLILRYLIR